MEKQVEDIKVKEVSRIHSTGQEFIVAENQGEQTLELTRFPAIGEGALCKGHYYRGRVSPKPPLDPNKPDKRRNAKFELICEINEFGGIETPFDDDGSEEMDARTKSILVQSDMRTAAILLAGLDLPNDETGWPGKLRFVYDIVKQFREEQEKS